MAKHGTAIEWTHVPDTRGVTWNPVRARRRMPDGRMLTGWHCEHVTAACANCYSEAQNRAGARGGTKLPFKPGHRDDVEIFVDEKTLTAPLRWQSPRTIFVCSMTDLFGSWMTDAWLTRIYEVMAACPQHTFIVLTKRPGTMRRFLEQRRLRPISMRRVYELYEQSGLGPKTTLQRIARMVPPTRPLKNLWGGTSVGDQDDADRFLADVVEAQLAVRIVSFEPALGHVDFRPWLDRLDWVICGGESGAKARPMHPDWARSIRDQCAAAGVPFFFKQWGEHAPVDPSAARFPIRMGEHFVARVGKRAAGRLLDGLEHSAFPKVSSKHARSEELQTLGSAPGRAAVV